MCRIAATNRFTVGFVVAAVTFLGAAVPVEAAAADEFRLALPDGPFEQWKTISFTVEPVVDDPGAEAADWVDLELTITAPSGKSSTIPIFPNLDNADAGRLQGRFTPREVGRYTAKVNTAGDTQRQSLEFDVAPSPSGRGFLNIDRNQPYFLTFDSGEQFRGVGTNIGWEPRRRKRAEHTYDALFPRIAANGLNTVRTWICPWNLSPDWNASPLGTYDSSGLKRLDEMLSLAESNGIYVVLVLGYHGELQTESGAFPGNDRWKENPYNVTRGGPCETPAEFFTNDEAKAFYKQRLRLLVARIASHPHLLAWEFWNEIDHIEKRGPVPGDALVRWHEEMADYLRTIDPYDHPITTSISVKAPNGLWELDNVDLIMLHPYGKTDNLVKLLGSTTERFLKPTIAGEFSYSWLPAKTGEADDFERELKLGLWRGLMSPTPVLPMTWWWEYHDSRNDWRLYQPISACSNMMTATRSDDWSPVATEIRGNSLERHGVRVGNRVFLWLRNPNKNTASDVRVVFRDPPSGSLSATTLSTVSGQPVLEGAATAIQRGNSIEVTIPSLKGHQDTLIVLE